MRLPKPLPDELVELIADRLRALGQPSRIRIIDHLDRHGETTVQALADLLEVGQQNVSRHLNLLHRRGVVSRRQDGRLVWYRLTDASAAPLLDQVGAEILEQLRGLGPGHDDAGHTDA